MRFTNEALLDEYKLGMVTLNEALLRNNGGRMFTDKKVYQAKNACVIKVTDDGGICYQVQEGEEGRILSQFDTKIEAVSYARCL